MTVTTSHTTTSPPKPKPVPPAVACVVRKMTAHKLTLRCTLHTAVKRKTPLTVQLVLRGKVIGAGHVSVRGSAVTVTITASGHLKAGSYTLRIVERSATGTKRVTQAVRLKK